MMAATRTGRQTTAGFMRNQNQQPQLTWRVQPMNNKCPIRRDVFQFNWVAPNFSIKRRTFQRCKFAQETDLITATI